MICKGWDGLYASYPFTPNSVTSSAVCNDPAPTWIYEINPSTIDTKLVKITIDSSTNTINLKPMSTGTGTVQATLTVTGRLPTGQSASWTFSIAITSCINTPLTPPTLVNQNYLVFDPQASYTAPSFTITATCPQPLTPTYTISTNNWITGFFGNNGIGYTVAWYSADPTKEGSYTITLSATNVCKTGTASYTLTVRDACKSPVFLTASTIPD